MKWFDDADAQHCVAGECLAAPLELEGSALSDPWWHVKLLRVQCLPLEKM